jgi:Tol biopolymer transport system component
LLAFAEAGLCRIDVQTGDFERIVPSYFGWTAVWSRDGKAIFYHQWDPTTRKASIALRDLATQQEKVLHSVAAPSAYYGGLALSRDGQQLAFMVNDLESGPRVLNVMPASGGTARELLREGRPLMQHPAVWTPDGLSLLFARQHGPGDPKTDLWLISAQGGEPRKLDLTAAGMRDLCMHPDGRHIAFTAGPSQSEVWVMENFLPAAK